MIIYSKLSSNLLTVVWDQRHGTIFIYQKSTATFFQFPLFEYLFAKKYSVLTRNQGNIESYLTPLDTRVNNCMLSPFF